MMMTTITVTIAIAIAIIIIIIMMMIIIIVSITKFLIVIGSLCAYLSHNWHAIMWESDLNFFVGYL